MYVLHYYPGNASLLPHMLLREIGAPFELRLVDRTRDAHKSPEYLALNPNGLIPVLIDGDLVLYETAAVAMHLCDRHPEAGLAPPLGTPERAHFYKWMAHLTNTVQAEYLMWFYPERYVDLPDAVPRVKAVAEARLDVIFDRIAGQLGGKPWLLGERFSAADLFLAMVIRWGRNLARPPRTVPALGVLAERVLARPAVRAAFEAEGLRPPLI
jgi:glutathione S-transferase